MLESSIKLHGPRHRKLYLVPGLYAGCTIYELPGHPNVPFQEPSWHHSLIGPMAKLKG